MKRVFLAMVGASVLLLWTSTDRLALAEPAQTTIQVKYEPIHLRYPKPDASGRVNRPLRWGYPAKIRTEPKPEGLFRRPLRWGYPAKIRTEPKPEGLFRRPLRWGFPAKIN